LECVLEVHVPSYAVAAAVDVVLDGTFVSDLSGYLEATFGDDGRSVDNSSTCFPYAEDLDAEPQLDRQAQ
jgi:hypothetical protein